MAHGLQRRAVRAGRHAARVGLRALSGAALLLTLAAAARAQAPNAGAEALARSGLPDAEAWWAEPGRPGWVPDDALGTAYPPAYSGLVVGGWRLEELRRAPGDLPWPGVRQARTPLGWYDSLAVVPGDGAWDGYRGALAELRAWPVEGTRRRTRSSFSLSNGTTGLDQNALTVSRDDSLHGLGVEAMSGHRGALAGMERSGRHLWGARGFVVRGRHRLSIDFSQRAGAIGLPGGEQQDAKGQSGSLGWSWRRGELRASAEAARGLDRHTSEGGVFVPSMRDAQENVVSLAVGRARGRHDLEARIEGSQAEVRRQGTPQFSTGARSAWGAVRATFPAGRGTLVLGLGGGRHGGVDRVELAPSARWASRLGAARTEIALERLLAPVWTDLGEGTGPFLQRTSAAAVRIALGDSGAWRARGSMQAGRTQDRALAFREPMEELWLRRGLDRDPALYDFALAEGGVEARRGNLVAGVEGFGRAERRSHAPAGEVPPLLSDPRGGFRAWAGTGTRLFRGDLGLTLRGEAEGVGQRQGFTSLAGTGVRVLPAFVTFNAVAELTLGDVIAVVRARNLEDRQRPLPWVELDTGLPALGGGRELRLDLVWRLFD